MLWEHNIGKLQGNTTYKLDGAIIKEFNDTRHLSIDGEVKISQEEDIEVVTDTGDCTVNKSIEGQIIGVLSTDEYLSCLNCKSKVNQISLTTGQCHRCLLKMKLSMCETHSSASIIFRSSDNTDYRVQLYTKELAVLTQNIPGITLADRLLNAPSTITLFIDKHGIGHIEL